MNTIVYFIIRNMTKTMEACVIHIGHSSIPGIRQRHEFTII